MTEQVEHMHSITITTRGDLQRTTALQILGQIMGLMEADFPSVTLASYPLDKSDESEEYYEDGVKRKMDGTRVVLDRHVYFPIADRIKDHDGIINKVYEALRNGTAFTDVTCMNVISVLHREGIVFRESNND